MTAILSEPVRLLPGEVSESEWLEARKQGIGASEVAAALAISKWDGPLVVYGTKVHGYRKPVTDAMEIGTELEPWLVRKFEKQHPELTVTAKPGLFRGEQPWHLATPDAVACVGQGVPTDLVEAKTACRFGDDADDGWGEAGTDEVPFHYIVQATWACQVLGLSRWHIPVLFLDNRSYAEYRGEYSPALGDQLAERVDRFWLDHIVARVEPSADRFESTRLLLSHRHVAKRKSEGQLPYEALTWAAEYLDLRDQRGDISKEMDERANLLRQAHVAAGCEVGLVGDVPVSSFTRAASGSTRLNVKESAR